MRIIKSLLCIYALLLALFLFGCMTTDTEESTTAKNEEITTEDESATVKEDVTVEYEAERIEVKEKSDAPLSVKLDKLASSVIVELLNKSDKWVHKTSHASYNYVFVLSNKVSVEFCSVHGIFKDKTVGKELRLSDSEMESIKKLIPLDPVKTNYADIAEQIAVGKTYSELFDIIGDRGIETDANEFIYRWIFADGTVLYIDFEEPDMTAFDYPEDLIASSIKTEKLS